MIDQQPGAWAIEHRLDYPSINEVALAPDGGSVLYVVSEPLLADDKSEFVSQIYRAAPGREPEQLTFGEYRNDAPRWSPDGRQIAFLSRRSGRANIYVMAAAGGEARALTRCEKTDVAALKWSPDGTSLAFLMVEPPSEARERAVKAKDDPLRWEIDLDFTHLWLVPYSVDPRQAPVAKQLTRGRYQVAGFDWLPGGDALAITHRPTPGFDSWPEIRLATIRADGSSEAPADTALVADIANSPLVSPDGQWIACFTSDRPVQWGTAGRIVLYPVGGGEPRPLAHTPDGCSWPIGWTAEGDGVLALDCVGTTSQIWSLPVSGDVGRRLTSSPLLKELPVVNARGQVAFVGQDFDQPNAVYLLESDGTASLIARPPLPDTWPTAALPVAEVIQWSAPDGRPIEGIVAFPLNYTPGQRCPLIVCVHGGPTGVFQRNYLAAPTAYPDFAALINLTERGFAILMPNPRGSTGYGREFRFANYRDWGGGDYQDVMSGVDHLIARGIADPDRLGILGWSYGGYLTSSVITQTHRFKAACVGAGVTNLIGMNGTSDIPGFIPDYLGAEFWEDLEAYVRHSPVLNARGVQTPTLILHGDQDLRVPLGQGRELYNALKRQGVPTELVIYPRQGHVLNEPRLIVDMSRRTTDWLARYVLGEDRAT